jgi:NAD(P)-dependent dehydrogenase (short-subunit alcohol dehydrogenase family)
MLTYIPTINLYMYMYYSNFDVNFFSIITLVQHALPALRESKGRVIFVSSGAAVNAYHGWGAYCA